MNLPPTVNTGQSLQDLIDNIPDDPLWNFPSDFKKELNEPSQRPVIHVLHKHEKRLLVQESKVIVDDV